jgi:hypothetical protein
LADILPEEIKERLQNGRIVVGQEVLSPINVVDAVKAMQPAKPFGPPLFIRPVSESGSWKVAAAYQRTIIDDALSRSRGQLPRFSIFSLSPTPLAMHLGFLLSDRVETEIFQFDRDRKTWSWDPCASPGDMGFRISGVPKAVIRDPMEVILRVSLSAPIRREDTVGQVDKVAVEIDMSVEASGNCSLKSGGLFRSAQGSTFSTPVPRGRQLSQVKPLILA